MTTDRIGKRMQDIIVIGGGASGMTAAICAAREGGRVLLIEKGTKLGRKIAASGNGKCNLTNADILIKHYHNAYPNELEQILEQANLDTVLEFMNSIGVHCKTKRGYYYPMSEQAAVVVQMLQAELEHLHVKIICDERLTDVIHNADNTFCVVTDKSKYCTRKLILSCGGMSAEKLGAEETGYQVLRKLGHTVVPTAPALVQLTAKERYIKKISGVRTEAQICLVTDDKSYFEEGEIIFTDTGVSGIPVFQLSRYVTEAINKKRIVKLYINVLPQIDADQIYGELIEFTKYNPDLTLEYLFRSLCNHKLVYAIICENGLSAEMPCKAVKQSDIRRLLHVLQRIEITITGTNGFEHAQVTRGGVPLYEINPMTMESKKYPGLFITGELLDIDGICGGYNLHFAWASGMMAGVASAK